MTIHIPAWLLWVLGSAAGACILAAAGIGVLFYLDMRGKPEE